MVFVRVLVCVLVRVVVNVIVGREVAALLLLPEATDPGTGNGVVEFAAIEPDAG